MDVLTEVKIGEHDYRIRKLSAEVGSLILMRLVKTMQTAMSGLSDTDVQSAQQEANETEDSTAKANGAIMFLLTNLDDKTFQSIQRYALEVCERKEVVGGNEVWLPVMRNGVIAARELKDDISTILSLTSKALFANLHPFFAKNGLRAVLTGE